MRYVVHCLSLLLSSARFGFWSKDFIFVLIHSHHVVVYSDLYATLKNNTMTIRLFLLVVCFSTLMHSQAPVIEWVQSTATTPWVERQVTPNATEATKNILTVYPDQVQQRIDGFGGCFNELGWEAIKSLPPTTQEEVLTALFDKEKGCNFSIYRMPMGANDYAVNWYSHNEVADDFEMQHFSIQRDRQRLLPYIKKAQSYNPALQIWASPWCPPSWMKNNKHYACQPASVNDLPAEGKGQEMQTQFIMEDQYLSAYALYFSKFIKAYAAEGVTISAVHVQNEPNSCQNFPSCVWTPTDLATFIGGYLGPHFEAAKLDADIWLGTVERPYLERITPIVTDAKARKYIKGVGFQWGGKGAIPKVHNTYPELALMQTETECGNGSNDWAAAVYTYGLLQHYFNHGANSYMYWNMVLNETGKSRWGWKQNSMISVHSTTHQVTYNPEFYLMKHFSNFVTPASYKIQTSTPNCLAFKSTDSIVIVYYHSADSQQKTTVRVGEQQFDVVLEKESFNTFVIPI